MYVADPLKADIEALSLDGMQKMSSASISKLEMYANAELGNTRREMIAASHGSETGYASESNMSMLSYKLKLLLMVLDPKGSFLI
jgi:hypothetical protein